MYEGHAMIGNFRFSRVPCVGEEIYLSGKVYEVRRVSHDPESAAGSPEATVWVA
jgi:hypothetical protein